MPVLELDDWPAGWAGVPADAAAGLRQGETLTLQKTGGGEP